MKIALFIALSCTFALLADGYEYELKAHKLNKTGKQITNSISLVKINKNEISDESAIKSCSQAISSKCTSKKCVISGDYKYFSVHDGNVVVKSVYFGHSSAKALSPYYYTEHPTAKTLNSETFSFLDIPFMANWSAKGICEILLNIN